jgi:hypothetical protein
MARIHLGHIFHLTGAALLTEIWLPERISAERATGA